MSSATVDANVLLYASDASSDHNVAARRLLQAIAAGPDLFYLFWPTMMAYLRISTHPAVFEEPLTPEQARANVAALLSRSHVRSPGEADGFWGVFEATSSDMVVRGNLVSDAHLAALMRQHGVATIWTHDRDLRRFDGLGVRDPFV